MWRLIVAAGHKKHVFRNIPLLGALAAYLLFQVALPRVACGAFKHVAVGETPPAFAMDDIDGVRRHSAELLGKRVAVVVFWATWSPRSHEILAGLERLRIDLGPERVALVAINVEHLVISDADREAIRSVVGETGTTAIVLLDEGLVAFNAFGTMAVPSSLVLDAQERVAFTLAGYPTTMRSDLDDAVRKALGLPTSVELRPPQEYVPKNHALMYYSFGRRLLEKGQEEKAVEQLLIAVERDPGYKKPYLELGLHHMRNGRPEQALEAFMKVREIDPHDPEAAYQAGAANLRAERFEEAAAVFQELASEFPDRGGYALALALTRKFQGREGEYRAGADAAGGLLPPEPRILYDFGAMAERRGFVREAVDLYRRAIEGVLR